MTNNQLLIDGFGRVKSVVQSASDGLTQDQLSYRVKPSANSIAWLIWHLSRVQDSHIAELLDSEQLWLSQGWVKKFDLGLDESSTGYGHTSEQVAKVIASAQLLRDYHQAVHDQTINYLKSLNEQDYDKIIDTNWNPPVILGARLISVLDDNMQHSGQAAYIRGLLD